MTALGVLILALATWRLSSLLVYEDGPYAIFARFRHFAGIEYDEYSNVVTKNVFAEMINCIHCSSCWIGATLAILYYLIPPPTVWVALPLALSTAAIVIERIVPE